MQYKRMMLHDSSLRFAFLTAAAIIMVAMVFVPSMAVEMPDRGICAHRGAIATHPENTLAAFREAVRLGAHQIEFDIRNTADGKLVVMHDSLLTRTTNVKDVFPDQQNDLISSFTLAKLKQLDAGSWKGSQFLGEQIPTLAETLAIMPQNVWLNVHLKGSGADFAESVANVVLKAGREHQVFLAALMSHLPGIEKAEQVSGKNILTCNMNTRGKSTNYVDQTINGGYNFLQFNGRGFPLASDIQRLKDHGVRINFFGTDDPAILTYWFKNGIDFPLANNLAASMSVAKGLGIEPLTPLRCKPSKTLTTAH